MKSGTMPSNLSDGISCVRQAIVLCVCVFFNLQAGFCEELNQRSMGFYAGQYHDTEPASFIKGQTHFQNQYLLALTASQTFWHSDVWPVSAEIDGMVGYQWGQSSLYELAVAPVLRLSGLPGRDILAVDFRVAPLGISYTSSVSSLERGANGKGSKFLNFLMLEVTASQASNPGHEWFARLHHRCTIYGLMDKYGANGEDFFAIGWRKRF